MKKPLIGIMARPTTEEEKSKLFVNEDYRKVILAEGGVPFLILPPQNISYNQSHFSENKPLTKEEKEILIRQLELCDGMVFPGGNKMFEHDFFALEYAIEKDIPILGICLGMQIMSNYKRQVWNEKNKDTSINHCERNADYAHDVIIDPKSKLYQIVGAPRIRVNSLHQFHVLPNDSYKTVGKSEDGLIEAIEKEENTFHIGVQWHPEIMYSYDEYAQKLWKSFLQACRNHQVH